MVALRKLFYSDKGSSVPSADLAPQDVEADEQCQSMTDGTSAPSTSEGPPVPPKDSKDPGPIGVDHHFLNIERQFEELHDQLQSRPDTSYSQAPSLAPSHSEGRNRRHVDLLDALFSSHRYHIRTKTLSPITPYNEDIAERNMTRFLQEQQLKVKGKVCSRFMSAIYQEDVADRNIARSRGNSGSWSHMSSRPSSAATGLSCPSRSSLRSQKRDSNRLSGPKRKNSKRSTSNSKEDLRSRSRSPADGRGEPTKEAQPNQTSHLRPQKSAPNLSVEGMDASQRQIVSNFLGVPPAHKQGSVLSNAPLPDSPTLPVTMSHQPSGNGHKRVENTSQSNRSSASSTSVRTAAKKNVRDLSINTELASSATPGAKIAHRTIQPPTPGNHDTKRNASIAEVMHSPLPVGASPPPHSANYNVTEIMDMFKQAYISTQALSPHPTFETLQDAIIREINSHEAFQRVPAPDAGPAFTPSPSRDSFERESRSQKACPDLSRSHSAKEGQFSRLLRKGSLKRIRRDSESRRSISTIGPPKGHDKIFRRPSVLSGRRRHTDAPPPSPGFLEAMQQGSNERSGDSLTYVDLLLRNTQQTPLGSKKRSNSMARKPGSSHSAAPFSSSGVSDPLNARSVYRMRAHTSVSLSSCRPDFSAEDSDDEIIQLPSVGAPRVQIQSVDENNVKYVVDGATPDDAYKLMNWSKKARKNNGSQRPVAQRASSSPLLFN